MINPKESDAEEIMKDFQELIDHAKSEIPEFFGQFEAYASAQAEMESFRTYLDIINDTPNVVTANRAS